MGLGRALSLRGLAGVGGCGGLCVRPRLSPGFGWRGGGARGRWGEKKERPRADARGPSGKSRRRATLPRANPAVPSPMRPFTSVFGMGTGVSSSPWPPGKGNGRFWEGCARVFRGGGLALLREVVAASLWAISIGRLSASPRVHRRPIKVVVFHPPSPSCDGGNLVFGEAWRLDAFSAYPFRT